MERQRGHRCRDAVGGGSAGDAGDGSRLRLAQQHARRQGFDARVDLPDPGRHVHVLSDNAAAAGRAQPGQLFAVAHHARTELLHDLRRPAHQNQPHRPHPGRQQEAHPHRQIPLALRHRPGPSSLHR